MTDNLNLPTAEDIGKLLHYLAETDEPMGRLVAAVKAKEHVGKVIKAQAFIGATGGVAVRNAEAETSDKYKAWIEEYENLVADKEIMAAKRKTRELVIDLFRTISASRRAGQIL